MPNASQFSRSQMVGSLVFKVVLVMVVIVPVLWFIIAKYASENMKHQWEASFIRNEETSRTSKPANGSSNTSETARRIVPREKPELVEGLGNFEPPEEPPRYGPGEDGMPHELRPHQEFNASSSFELYGMNMVCSNEIALDRSIPDLRDPECKHWSYPEKLPNASVVVVFHNEGFSSLMRTVHSVINRTPPQFLAEVLLVDDNSTYRDLGAKLDSYIARWGGKVRLIRNKQREGLINSRSKGAREARGEVVVFLDAHCEVNINWLPPLLAPIRENPKTLTVPIIDAIDSSNFEIRPVYPDHQHFKGIFEWGMLYKEKELVLNNSDTLNHHTEPYRSPTHAGGLLAINRKYFLELGAYDPGLLLWGGENFELSFKIWLCGGRLLWVPCSRVGHVYKQSAPYDLGSIRGPVTLINFKRVVETWMDGRYKTYFYTRQPQAKYFDMGNITRQLALKNKLKCKSFKWYMKNVADDLTSEFPEPPRNLHWGELQNVATSRCLDTFGRDVPGRMLLARCHHDLTVENQLMRLNDQGQLGVGERCVEANSYGVALDYCIPGKNKGPWRYNGASRVIYHTTSQKCLGVDNRTAEVVLLWCNPVSEFQQWLFVQSVPHEDGVQDRPSK